MSHHPRSPDDDEDGVRVIARGGDQVPQGRRGGAAMIAVIAVLGAGGAWYFARPSAAPVAPAAPPAAARASSASDAAAAAPGGVAGEGPAAGDPPDQPARPARVSNPAAAGAQGRPVAAAVQAPSDAAAAEQAERREIERVAQEMVGSLRAAGRTDGLAAFPPPGTNPVKSGIIVPADFELPKGYVRHYQITDAGERLEPILMFSPDDDVVDDAGRPVALPNDGIVPPNLAPAGMPVRMLDVPDDADAAAQTP